jgi:hypothetical protein
MPLQGTPGLHSAQTQRFSEREPAVVLRFSASVGGGWLPSLTFDAALLPNELPKVVAGIGGHLLGARWDFSSRAATQRTRASSP